MPTGICYTVLSFKLGCFVVVHVLKSIHTHIQSWKLGPDFVFLAKFCPRCALIFDSSCQHVHVGSNFRQLRPICSFWVRIFDSLCQFVNAVFKFSTACVNLSIMCSNFRQLISTCPCRFKFSTGRVNESQSHCLSFTEIPKICYFWNFESHHWLRGGTNVMKLFTAVI